MGLEQDSRPRVLQYPVKTQLTASKHRLESRVILLAVTFLQVFRQQSFFFFFLIERRA